jgi:hypothetical protein
MVWDQQNRLMNSKNLLTELGPNLTFKKFVMLLFPGCNKKFSTQNVHRVFHIWGYLGQCMTLVKIGLIKFQREKKT